jgi:hypothetical protein
MNRRKLVRPAIVYDERQQAVVCALRADNHSVYDFRNPASGDQGFSWRECATEAQLRDPKKFRGEVLTQPIAKAGFEKDMSALRGCAVCVLVLPCGRSAHLELGYAVGATKRTIVLLADPLSEPELMYLMCSEIVCSMPELVMSLGSASRSVTLERWKKEDLSIRRDILVRSRYTLTAQLNANAYLLQEVERSIERSR